VDPWTNKGGNRRVLESSENGSIIYQNIWDTAKAVIKARFIAMSANVKKTEISNKEPSAGPQAPRKQE
jgi:hypothetical protein